MYILLCSDCFLIYTTGSQFSSNQNEQNIKKTKNLENGDFNLNNVFLYSNNDSENKNEEYSINNSARYIKIDHILPLLHQYISNIFQNTSHFWIEFKKFYLI